MRAILAANAGMTTREAFTQVAEASGRSVGTVQTSYYRMAREDPTSGVKTRPRSGKRAARRAAASSAPAEGRGPGGRGPGRRRASSGGDLDRLIERYLDAQTALLDHVKQLDRERRDLDRIKALLR